MEYSKLNESIRKELNSKYNDLDYQLLVDFVDMILKYNYPKSTPKYLSHMGTGKCIEYATDFLNTIDEKYASRLRSQLDNYGVEFTHENPELGSCLRTYGESKYITIHLRGTIADSYALTRETVHDIHTDTKLRKRAWYLMTDALAYLAERLQLDYFSKLEEPPGDFENIEFERMEKIYSDAMGLDFSLQLLKLYESRKFIDQHSIEKLILESRYPSLIASIYLPKALKEGIKIRELEKGVVGGILSSYMYQRICDNPRFIAEFKELNGMLNEYSFNDILKYLELDVSNDSSIISDKSLDSLSSAYEKRYIDVTRHHPNRY